MARARCINQGTCSASLRIMSARDSPIRPLLQNRTYFFEAETQTDAFEWIQTIGELLLRHQQGMIE